MKADNATALKALQLAMQDLAKQEELEAQRLKNEGPKEEDTWMINDGLEKIG